MVSVSGLQHEPVFAPWPPGRENGGLKTYFPPSQMDLKIISQKEPIELILMSICVKEMKVLTW